MTFQTDKIENGYLPAYLRIAVELGTAARVLELGIDQGHGLVFFRSIFPDGWIVGVDYRPECIRSSILLGGMANVILMQSDQADPLLPERIGEYIEGLDLIVDDASHQGGKTLESLHLLWPMLEPGGFYVIEDWGVAFKNAASMYDQEMWELACMLPTYFDPSRATNGVPNLAQVTYLPGLIILRKER